MSVSLPDILNESAHQSQTNTVVPDPAMTGLVIMWGFRIFLSQCTLYKAAIRGPLDRGQCSLFSRGSRFKAIVQ